MKQILLILLSGLSFFSYGQTQTDTLRVVHYNLLYYRATTTSCTVNNNNPTTKDGYIKTIMTHLKPTLFTVNELGADGTGVNAKKILDNGLNVDGVKHYKMANYSGNSNLSNMLYYDSRYFTLFEQDKVSRAINGTSLVRQIDVYRLFYLDQSELDAGDTTFMVVYTAHLKAGNGSSERAERAKATEALMQYHEDNYTNDNYILTGDLNVYTSSEACYKDLTDYSNPAVQFNDPVNKAGSWNNNGNYGDVHTQSTHTSSGCHSGGGLDDRFDFILCGDEIISNSRGIGYIPGSYKAVGNDGAHFNSSIISGANPSVPGPVLSALYNMSDHLPVYLEVGVTRTTASLVSTSLENQLVIFNPVRNELVWKLEGQVPVKDMFVLNAEGRLIDVSSAKALNTWNRTNVALWSSGMYTAVFYLEDGSVIRKKIIKI